MKSDDFRHRYFESQELGSFRSLLFGKLCNEDCGVGLRFGDTLSPLNAGRTDETDLEFQQCQRSFVLHGTLFEHEFYFCA